MTRPTNVEVDVSLTAIETTESGWLNNRDETYLVAKTVLSNGKEIIQDRISPEPPEDYLQFKNGDTINNIGIVNFDLKPGETAHTTVVIAEQDNAELKVFLGIVLPILTVVGGAVSTAVTSGLSLPKVFAAGASFAKALSNAISNEYGDQTIGGFQIFHENIGGVIHEHVKPLFSGTIVSNTDDDRVKLEALGDGNSHYQVAVQTNTSMDVTGNDFLQGGEDDNVLQGGSGIDTIYGNGGNDLLFGNKDIDILSGGKGNDRAHGGLGNDLLSGGKGDDTLFGDQGNDIIEGQQGVDLLFGGGGDDALFSGSRNGSYSDNNGDFLFGGQGNDFLTAFGNTGNNSMNGNDGQDQIYGGLGNDSVLGGSGDDSLSGHDGNDLLKGDMGNDTIVAWLGTDSLYGGEGNDILEGQQGLDILYGGGGNDTLFGGSKDEVYALQHGHDHNDFIDGGLGDDLLIGGEGDDLLKGSGGNDVLTGGAGNDQFIFSNISDGTDIITDFNPREDLISFSAVFLKNPTGFHTLKDSIYKGHTGVGVYLHNSNSDSSEQLLAFVEGWSARQLSLSDHYFENIVQN